MGAGMKNVLKWRETVERYCDGIDTASVLALIAVESAGDEYAHRPMSQFYGLLQMGRSAGIDIGLTDQGRKTTECLHGDGEFSIDAFSDYARKYQQTGGDMLALLWKGGPGYVKTVKREMDRGASFNAAVDKAAAKFGFSASAYLSRFRKHLAWVHDELD